MGTTGVVNKLNNKNNEILSYSMVDYDRHEYFE